MADPINGALEEWVEIDALVASQTCWERPGRPEDGQITLMEELTFEEYYAQRQLPTEGVLVLTIKDALEKIDALTLRVAALEGTPPAKAKKS